MAEPKDTRIPVTLLTGFLGSGKTTLLNHWVRQPELADCAILINEFGAIGIDHHLVKKIDEQVMLLDSGCICCSVQGSWPARCRSYLCGPCARRSNHSGVSS